MEGDADRFGMGACKLDRRGPDELVEGRLRGPVAVPAAQAVIADAADPGGKRREHGAAGARQAREEVLHQQRRTDGVEREGPGHVRRVDLAQRPFGHIAVAVQEPRRVEDEAQGMRRRCGLGRRRVDRRFVEEVERRGAGPAERQDLGIGAAVAEGRNDRRADAAAGTDDDGEARRRPGRISDGRRPASASARPARRPCSWGGRR